MVPKLSDHRARPELEEHELSHDIPWLVGFIGYGASGWLSDRVFDRTGNALTARKWVLIGCLGTSALFIALAGLVTTTASALLLVSGAVLALCLSGSTYWAIIQDVVPSAKVGSVGGLVHAVANCAGIFGPTTITGYLVEGTGSFGSAFFLAGGVALLGVGAVLLLIRPIPPSSPSPRTVVARGRKTMFGRRRAFGGITHQRGDVASS